MLQLLAIFLMSSFVHALDYKFVHPRCTDTCHYQLDGQYLDCARCDRFVVCSGDQLYRMGCPHSTAYDGYLGVCVHPTQPGCSLETGARDPPLKPGHVVQQSRPDPAPGEYPPSAVYRNTSSKPSSNYPSPTKQYPSTTELNSDSTIKYPLNTNQSPTDSEYRVSETIGYPTSSGGYPAITSGYPSTSEWYRLADGPSGTKEYPSGTKEYPSSGKEYPPSTTTDQYAATVYSPTTETPDYPNPDGYITHEPPYVSTSITANDYQPPSNPQTNATANQPTNPSNPAGDLAEHPLAYTAGSEPSPALSPTKTTVKTPGAKREPGHDLNSYGLAYDPFNPIQHPSSRGCSNCKKSCADAPTTNSIIVTCDECCYLDCATQVKVCP